MEPAGRASAAVGSTPATLKAVCDARMLAKGERRKGQRARMAERKKKHEKCVQSHSKEDTTKPKEECFFQEADGMHLWRIPLYPCFEIAWRFLRSHDDQHSCICFGLNKSKLMRYYCLAIDFNDSVFILDYVCGNQRQRIQTLPESSLATLNIISLRLQIFGLSMTLYSSNEILLRYTLEETAAGYIGYMGNNIVNWQLLNNHEATAFHVATMARRAAAAAGRAARIAVIQCNSALVTTTHQAPEQSPPEVSTTTSKLIYRTTQRGDIGLLCQQCGVPFTKLAEPMVISKRRDGICLRSHAECPSRFPTLYSRHNNYADSWLRSRIESESRRPERPPMNTFSSELVRSGDRFSTPLSERAYSLLIAKCLLPQADCLEDATDCPICMLQLNKNVIRLPCSHLYHESCLRPWLKKCSLCPTCRCDVLHCGHPSRNSTS